MLVAKQQLEASKPMPEFEPWKGHRILYCTEPKHDDALNSGILKDLTGNDVITYRLLYSNEIVDLCPQFKMHIVCNDPPKVERCTRKIDYISQFVAKDKIDEKQHLYQRDESFVQAMESQLAFRMEFMRYILDRYE